MEGLAALEALLLDPRRDFVGSRPLGRAHQLGDLVIALQ